MTLRCHNVATVVVVVVLATAAALTFTDSADDKFKQCCDDAEIPCIDVCNYSNRELTLSQRKCALANMPKLLECGTGGKDNRECCEKAGVDQGGRAQQCLDLCWPSGITPSGQLLPCSSVTEQIVTCAHDANI